MPKIVIETCERTPNYCALEAITISMKQNYVQRFNRRYKHETIVKVKSGRTLKVIETPADFDDESPCNAKYKVESL